MRKRNQPTEGVRARRYRRLQLLRGVAFASVCAGIFAFAMSLLLFRTNPERITLTDWAATRAFSGKFSAAELRDTYKASHAAYKQYIKRDTIAIDHKRIDQSFDRVRSEAELVQVLSELISFSEDGYARLFTQAENDHIFALLTGKDIGVELQFNLDWQTNRWKVSNCPPESSAARAGIQVGDELISVGNNSVHVFGNGWQAGQNIQNALNNGILGSTVNVVVRRGEDFISAEVERVIVGSAPPIDVSQPWNPFTFQQMTESKVIRIISMYHPDALTSFRKELENAQRDGFKGIVLNLTEAFSGDPETGLRMAAMLVDHGVLANRISITADGALEMTTWEVKDREVWKTTKGPYPLLKDGTISKQAKQDDRKERLDWPVALFKGQVAISVNNITRGAGEVIAQAAKQDPSRFVLVGHEWTGGKGTGLTYYPVGTGYVLRLSTSFWLQPDGKPIEGVGIEPDVGADPQADPTAVAGVILQSRLQVVPKPQLPPDMPEK